MIKNLSKILMIFSGLIVFSNAQSLDNQIKLADSLFKAENYYESITEYKRFLFFNDNSSKEFHSNYQIGMAYKAGAKLDESIRYLTLASVKANNNSEKYNVLTDLARAHILRKTCSQAHQILDKMIITENFNNNLNELKYWKAFAFIFEDKWQEAIYVLRDLPGENELIAICENVEDQKISEEFAEIISYIIPGSGQIYSGEYLSGIISLAWNVLLGYHTINAAVSERIFDSIVVGNLLWFRFYRGNIQNAQKYSKRKNLQITNKALEYLQREYQGLKP